MLNGSWSPQTLQVYSTLSEASLIHGRDRDHNELVAFGHGFETPNHKVDLLLGGVAKRVRMEQSGKHWV